MTPAKSTGTTRSGPGSASGPRNAGSETAVSAAAPSGPTLAPELWEVVLERMKARKRLLWGVLSQGEPGAWDGDTLLFRLDPKNRFHVEQLREPAHIGLIEQCLSEVCQRAVHFEVRLEDGAGAQAVPARRRVLEDPMVKKLLEVLDGEILE